MALFNPSHGTCTRLLRLPFFPLCVLAPLVGRYPKSSKMRVCDEKGLKWKVLMQLYCWWSCWLRTSLLEFLLPLGLWNSMAQKRTRTQHGLQEHPYLPRGFFLPQAALLIPGPRFSKGPREFPTDEQSPPYPARVGTDGPLSILHSL